MLSKPTGIVPPLLRGDVYWVNLDPTVGAEIKKIRPAVVIQNDAGNQHGAITIIAPISSTKGVPKKSPVFVYLNKGEGGLSEDSLVHCGQIRAVDKAARLINKLGQLSKKRMDEIDNALMLSLGLN